MGAGRDIDWCVWHPDDDDDDDGCIKLELLIWGFSCFRESVAAISHIYEAL